MALLIPRRSLLLIFLFVAILSLTSLFEETSAHESCCKYKLQQAQQQQQPPLIDDLSESPPSIREGQPHYIGDPNDIKPEDWDDEDDGDWVPVLIPNPNYAWKPRQIPNPDYIPPPTYWDKLRVEVLAAVPWVTLGVLITGLLSLVSLPMDTMQWWLQPSTSSMNANSDYDSTNSGSWMVRMAGRIVPLLSAALLGLATPLCSCGALPLCAALLKQGVPFSSAVAFLTASQSSGLDSAAVTYGLLGVNAMLGRLGGAIALALAVGLACGTTEEYFPSKEVTTKQSGAYVNSNKEKTDACHTASPSSSATSSSYSTTISGVLSTCLETATEIYPTVLMGLVLSTAALHFLPSLTSFVSSSSSTTDDDDLWVRILLLTTAVPLQFCEHTSVTLAAAIQKAGGSPGLAFAFLLAAPATNLPTILWMWNHYYCITSGNKANRTHRSSMMMAPISMVVLPLLVLCGTALGLSYLVDAWQLDLLAGESAGEMAQLPAWLADSSPYIAASLLSAGWYQKYGIVDSSSSLSSSSSKTNSNTNCGTCCGAEDPLVEKTKAE